MRYAFCPRRTLPCVTGGPLLRPLLNQNQTIRAHETMSFESGDVCYWEFKVDIAYFKSVHPKAELKDLFLNVVILNSLRTTTYQLQGDSRINATN